MTKMFACFRCLKRYAEMEDAERCEERHATPRRTPQEADKDSIDEEGGPMTLTTASTPAAFVDLTADGTDGIYADKQAEAVLSKRGHSLRFYRHGHNTCWHCGRSATLRFSDPSKLIWTLSGSAFETRCEWVGVPYAEIRAGDFVIQHSVNGATYGAPEKITKLTKTQITAGASRTRYLRTSGRAIGMTAFYVSVVRPRTVAVEGNHEGG